MIFIIFFFKKTFAQQVGSKSVLSLREATVNTQLDKNKKNSDKQQGFFVKTWSGIRL